MKEATLIYQTDPWHSKSSRILVAVTTTEKKRDKVLRKYIGDLMYIPRSLVTKAVEQVREYGQTSCLAEKYGIEILTEKWTLNEI